MPSQNEKKIKSEVKYKGTLNKALKNGYFHGFYRKIMNN